MGVKQERGVLFDLDGVLYNSSEVIPGAVEAVRWVQENRIPHLFVTNTTSRSRAVVAEKMGAFGFEISADDILTPAVAANEWLRTREPAGIALFVRPSTRAEFAGLPSVENEAESGAKYVVIGDLGEHWDFRTLNRAFRLLHYNAEAELIALGMTRYWRAADGISLDVAPFVAALEHATGRKAQVFGKPAVHFFEAAAKRLQLPGERLFMIGDDIQIDIGGAQAAGLRGVLVRTGKYQASDLEGVIQPDFVIDSIQHLPELWAKATSASGN